MKLNPLLQSVYIISLFCEFVFCSVRGKLYFEQFYGFFEVLFSSINVVNPHDITEILLCHSSRGVVVKLDCVRLSHYFV